MSQRRLYRLCCHYWHVILLKWLCHLAVELSLTDLGRTQTAVKPTHINRSASERVKYEAAGYFRIDAFKLVVKNRWRSSTSGLLTIYSLAYPQKQKRVYASVSLLLVATASCLWHSTIELSFRRLPCWKFSIYRRMFCSAVLDFVEWKKHLTKQ